MASSLAELERRIDALEARGTQPVDQFAPINYAYLTSVDASGDVIAGDVVGDSTLVEVLTEADPGDLIIIGADGKPTTVHHPGVIGDVLTTAAGSGLTWAPAGGGTTPLDWQNATIDAPAHGGYAYYADAGNGVIFVSASVGFPGVPLGQAAMRIPNAVQRGGNWLSGVAIQGGPGYIYPIALEPGADGADVVVYVANQDVPINARQQAATPGTYFNAGAAHVVAFNGVIFGAVTP